MIDGGHVATSVTMAMIDSLDIIASVWAATTGRERYTARFSSKRQMELQIGADAVFVWVLDAMKISAGVGLLYIVIKCLRW